MEYVNPDFMPNKKPSKIIAATFTDPDEGDKLDGQVITDTLEGRALSMALRPIVSKGELADLLVEFATKELAASDLAIAEAYRCGYESGKSEVESQLAAERTRREEAIRVLGSCRDAIAAQSEEAFGYGDAENNYGQNYSWPIRDELLSAIDAVFAQDSANTSESGSDLEANQTKP
jgi:hypothetical protein